MSPNPISKNQQVYTDQYGPTQTSGSNKASQDYDNFDPSAGREAQDDNLVYGDGYEQLAQGQQGEAPADQDLISGMNDEDYMAHYQNQVEPQNRQEALSLLDEMQNQSVDIAALKQELSEMKKLAQDPKNSQTLDGAAKNEILGKIQDLEKLAGKKDTGVGELQQRVTELHDEITNGISSGLETRQENIKSIKAQVSELKDQVENSKISLQNKDCFSSKLSDLENSLKDSTTDLDTTGKAIKELKKELDDTPSAWDKNNIAGNVPPDQNAGGQADRARDIINQIDTALQDGDWESVIGKINSFVNPDASLPPDGQERQRKIGNDVIRKFVTALFRASGSSRKEAIALLKNIPEEVRYVMIRNATIEGSEIGEKSDSDEFNSADSADLIRESIVGGTDTSSPPTPPTVPSA